jgi:soluble lytic murein transglycosylase-like protein
MKKVSILFFLVVSILVCSDPAAAGIYRYEDENGNVYFTNCPRDPSFKLYIRESREDVDGVRAEENGSAAPRISTTSNEYDSLIREYARKYEVDAALIKAIIRAESGFNPYAVSRKGARGLMQLMPQTAQRLSVYDSFNPRENIDGGTRYFKYLLGLFKYDLRLSLAAYNAGENLVLQNNAIPPYRETIDYIRKVLNFYQSYRN